MVRDVSLRLGFDEKLLDIDTILAIWLRCQYEQSWNSQMPDVWCAVSLFGESNATECRVTQHYPYFILHIGIHSVHPKSARLLRRPTVLSNKIVRLENKYRFGVLNCRRHVWEIKCEKLTESRRIFCALNTNLSDADNTASHATTRSWITCRQLRSYAVAKI